MAAEISGWAWSRLNIEALSLKQYGWHENIIVAKAMAAKRRLRSAKAISGVAASADNAWSTCLWSYNRRSNVNLWLINWHRLWRGINGWNMAKIWSWQISVVWWKWIIWNEMAAKLKHSNNGKTSSAEKNGRKSKSGKMKYERRNISGGKRWKSAAAAKYCAGENNEALGQRKSSMAGGSITIICGSRGV